MPVLQRTREGAPVDQWSTSDPVTGQRWYLRHCMEDHLRRLTPSFPRVFEIGKAVRAERRSAAHATEFLVLELVFRNLTYPAGISLIRRLVVGPVASAAEREFGNGDSFLNLQVRPWRDISLSTVGTTPEEPHFRRDCVNWLIEKGIRASDTYVGEWEVLEDIMKYAIEPACATATLITHFPAELQHVCQLGDGGTATRFSLVMNGIEFGDGGLKFADSTDYRRIYERNAVYRRDVLGLDGNDLPEEFFAEMDKYPGDVFTSGIGIDRLCALVAGRNVAEVIQFVEG
jgi:lysyl-tRNA synthetase class 2